MDSRTRERPPSPDAVEFVRFCHRRRQVGWPELYDEMCAVANRGLFRGWGIDELGAEGIGFSLFEMPSLASLVAQVVAEEHERRLAARAVVVRRPERAVDADHHAASQRTPESASERASDAAPEPARLAFAGAPAGA